MLIQNKDQVQLKLLQHMILMIMMLEKEINLEIINILEKDGKINKMELKNLLA